MYSCASHTGAPVDEDEVVQSGDISSGDYVKVELDPEVFKAMHEGNEEAGWDDLMLEVGSSFTAPCFMV